jgi:hypothetical protein
VLYTLLFFLPLFLVKLLSVAMLLLSPCVRLNRYTFFALAGMFLVFATWAVFGFAYPLSPLPITFNVVSKALAFVSVVTLFLPTDQMPQTQEGSASISAEEPAQEVSA